MQESLDLNMSPVPYIYWYNQSDRYLYRSYVDGPRVNDTNEEKRYIRWTTPDRVVSIIGYRKKQSERVNVLFKVECIGLKILYSICECTQMKNILFTQPKCSYYNYMSVLISVLLVLGNTHKSF